MNRSVASVFVTLTLFALSTTSAVGDEPQNDTVILQDNFDREEADPAKEQIGNQWGTNSAKRAKGVKQVDLRDGAMFIERADVADHAVSVTHEAAFQDATLRLRFKIGEKDDLGINIADMKEKSVHAGHICVARIRPHRVEITDLKTGRMNLIVRQRRLDDASTAEDKQLIKKTQKVFKTDLAVNQWHKLEVRIIGDKMSVAVDGEKVGEFASAGIAHPTKSRLRLSVGKKAWVDDVMLIRHR